MDRLILPLMSALRLSTGRRSATIPPALEVCRAYIRLMLALLPVLLVSCGPSAPTPGSTQAPAETHAPTSLPTRESTATAISTATVPPGPTPPPGNLRIASFQAEANLRLMDLAPALDGGFIAVGEVWPADNNTRAWLIKFGPLGEIEWQRTYDGRRMELGTSVAALQDGTFLLAGLTRSFGFDVNGFVIQTDRDGNILWQRYFGVDGADTILAIAEASDGRLAVAGETESYENGFPGWWIAELQEDGSLAWSATVHRNYYDLFHTLAVAPDGQWVMIGDTATSLAGPWSSTVVRFGRDGTVVSDLVFDTGGQSFSMASAVDADGHVLFSPQAQNGLLMGLLSFAGDGEPRAERWYGGGTPSTMFLDRDGGYLLGGKDGGNRRAGWLMKLDSQGEVLWSRRYDSVHGIDGVIETASGTLVAFGHTDQPHSDYGPVLLVLSPEGDVPSCSQIAVLDYQPQDGPGPVTVGRAAHRIQSIRMYSEGTEFLQETPEISLQPLCQGSGLS